MSSLSSVHFMGWLVLAAAGDAGAGGQRDS